MALVMGAQDFLEFYKETFLGYSKIFQRYVVKKLEEKHYITYNSQIELSDNENTIQVEKGQDSKAIAQTATEKRFSGFYESLEFTKLYKYSIPLFYENNESGTILECLKKSSVQEFDEASFSPSYMIATTIDDAKPLYINENRDVYVKFVLQKSYYDSSDGIQINYRVPIVIYFDLEHNILEVRFDSIRHDPTVSIGMNGIIVTECIKWLKDVLGISLFTCEHTKLISTIKDNPDGSVCIYKQMMELSSGGSAELTASEQTDYVLPFIGELRELISENEPIFDQSEEIKRLLLQYLEDKETTAHYPYVYIKWVRPIDSESYIVKIIFDYFQQKYTLMQHISGNCKDFGKERMNNAIKYLCESSSFTKGEKL